MRYIKRFSEVVWNFDKSKSPEPSFILGGGKYKGVSDQEVVKVHANLIDKLNEFSYLLNDFGLDTDNAWTTHSDWDISLMMRIDENGIGKFKTGNYDTVCDRIRENEEEFLEYFDRIVETLKSQGDRIECFVYICNIMSLWIEAEGEEVYFYSTSSKNLGTEMSEIDINRLLKKPIFKNLNDLFIGESLEVSQDKLEDEIETLSHILIDMGGKEYGTKVEVEIDKTKNEPIDYRIGIDIFSEEYRKIKDEEAFFANVHFKLRKRRLVDLIKKHSDIFLEYVDRLVDVFESYKVSVSCRIGIGSRGYGRAIYDPIIEIRSSKFKDDDTGEEVIYYRIVDKIKDDTSFHKNSGKIYQNCSEWMDEIEPKLKKKNDKKI